MGHRNIGQGDGGVVKTAPPAVGDRLRIERDEAGVMSYVEMWAEAINETYTESCVDDVDDVVAVLTKAAECLRDGATHTFTGPELDLVRHLMPAHEVHQSGAKRWLNSWRSIVTALSDHRELTAHHEAGHAVAAVMRGGELVSITIEPTDDYLGYTRTRAKVWDAAFSTFAGPWAEARAQWTKPTLDDIDDDGCTFDDYLVAAWLSNTDDRDQYEEDLDRERNLLFGGHWPDVIDPDKREQWWSTELEDYWPVIQAVAQLLLDGEHVDHGTVDGLLDRHWASLCDDRPVEAVA